MPVMGLAAFLVLTESLQDEEFFALQGPLGVSAVRLIPKPTGFRPIVNLGRRIVRWYEHIKLRPHQRQRHVPCMTATASTKQLSANQVLSSIHQIMSFEKVGLLTALPS